MFKMIQDTEHPSMGIVFGYCTSCTYPIVPNKKMVLPGRFKNFHVIPFFQYKMILSTLGQFS